MGFPKALLPVPPLARPLLRHLLDRLSVLQLGQIIVVGNEPGLLLRAQLPVHVRVLPDAYPGAGSLGGIATGLRACSGWAITVACDLPLINAALVQYLCQLTREPTDRGEERWDAIMPVVNGREEPLHAIYHWRCLPMIEARLASGERRVVDFLPDVRVRWVGEEEMRPLDPNLYSFFNANTPAEWDEALHLLRSTNSDGHK